VKWRGVLGDATVVSFGGQRRRRKVEQLWFAGVSPPQKLTGQAGTSSRGKETLFRIDQTEALPNGLLTKYFNVRLPAVRREVE